MSLLNTILRSTLDGFLYPFRGLSPWWGLAFISLLSAVGALLVIKRVSNQDGIARVKKQMHAAILEVRLLNDDLLAVLKAQGALLWANVKYMGLNVVPLLWLIVPFVLVFLHLEPRYKYRGLEPGDSTVVTARLAAEEGAQPRFDDPKPAVRLVVPEGLEVESPAVWTASTREWAWRVRAAAEGSYRLGVESAGGVSEKDLRVTDRSETFDPRRPDSAWLAQLVHPAEKPLPRDSGLEAIALKYPKRGWGDVAGIPLAWWFWWLVFMIGFGVLLRGPMGVEI